MFNKFKKVSEDEENLKEELFLIKDQELNEDNFERFTIIKDKKSLRKVNNVDNKEILNIIDNNVSNKKDHERNNSNEFITIIGNVDDEDFEIIESKSNFFKVFLKILKIFLLTIFTCLLTLIFLFLSLYKIIPENISSAFIRYNGYSVISNNYQPNLKELKSGDIIYINESINISPFIYNYKKLIFDYRKPNNPHILYCHDEYGNEIKILSTEIDYIGYKGAN